MKNINKNVTDNGETIVKSGGHINEFLWLCAGVNRRVLRQCPTDYAKYAGIGGTILFTALMAMLSGGYALYTVFHNQFTAILFGIFWGLLIFNLDRFIVNTMYSDGKVTISRREFFSGLPRIIMAIFLGIVISTPLEMKIFEDRIDVQLEKDNRDRSQAETENGDKHREYWEQKRAKLDKERQIIQDSVNKANDEYSREVAGLGPTHQVNVGPVARAYERKQRHFEENLKKWEDKNNSQYEYIKNQIDKNDSITKVKAAYVITEDGFCIRYEAFSKIKEENFSLNLVSIIIMLLFVIIETAPTFFKMMIASGPYDDLLRAEMHKARVLADKRISDLNDEVNTQVQISTAKNKERLETEVTANKELMKKLAKTQAELLQNAIDKWKEDEMAKIAQDPSLYIKGNHQPDDNLS